MDIDFGLALPPRTAARIQALRRAVKGQRSGAERQAHEQRMAEIQANLAIESMPLDSDEIAFIQLVFELNLSPDDEQALCRLWNIERLGAAVVAAE